MRVRRAAIATTVASMVVAALTASDCPSLPDNGSLEAGRKGSAVRAYEPAHRGGTLRMLARSAAGAWDPQVSYSPQFWQLLPAVYDGLMAFAQVNGPQSFQVVPDLVASMPQVERGGTRYVFTLRRGIRFSTGAAVTPGDVAASLRRIFTVGSPAAASYRSIVGADACLSAPTTCALPGVTVDEAAGTVTIDLVAPDADLLLALAVPTAAVLPAGTPVTRAATGTSQATTDAAPPAGTGAYRVASYDPAGSLVLERNPYFTEWSRAAQPDGYPDRIVEEFGHDPAAALTDVRLGRADALYDRPPPERLAELEAAGPAQVHVNPLTGLWYLALNTHLPPFDQLEPRQAVNWALDREAVARRFGGPALATPACTLLPAGILGHRQDCQYAREPGPGTGADLDRARALVSRSGTAGQRVRLLVPDDAVGPGVGQEVAAALEAVGYRASVRALAPDLYYRYVQDPGNDVQLSLANAFQDYPSPASFLQALLGCARGGDPSPSGSCDAALQSRVRAAAAVADRAAADRAWAVVDHDVMTAAPIAPLITPSQVDVVSTRVGNYQWSKQYRMIVSQLWVR